MALRDLADAQLRQLMEDLCQKVVQRDLTMSPIGPPSGHLRAPAGGVDTNLEDEEVNLQGGRDGDPMSCCNGPQAPLVQGRMLAASSAQLQLD